MEFIKGGLFLFLWHLGFTLTMLIFVCNRGNTLLSPIFNASDARCLAWLMFNIIAWPLNLAIILIIVSVTWIKEQYQKRIRYPDK